MPSFLPCSLGFRLCHDLCPPSPHLSVLCHQSSPFLSHLIIIGVVCPFSVSLPTLPPPPVILKVSITYVQTPVWQISGLGRGYTEWQICWSVTEMGRTWEYSHADTVWFNLLVCYGFHLSEAHDEDQAPESSFPVTGKPCWVLRMQQRPG